MTRTTLRSLAVVALAACGSDLSFNYGSVRGMVMFGNPPGVLDLYAAPPLRQLRSMPLQLSAGVIVSPALADPIRGGFYAIQGVPSTTGPVWTSWSLVRYGPDWTIAASRTSAELVGTDSLGLYPLALTPDAQLLVAQRAQSPNDLVVLDAATLTVLRTIPAPALQIYTGWGPTGTTGAQLLLRHIATNCNGYVVWMDAVTGAHVDSAGIPCNDQLGGALGPGQIYVMSDTLNARLELYDAHLGHAVAAQDSLSFPIFFPDTVHGLLIEPGGGLLVLVDAHTLKLTGTVPTGSGPAPRTVRFGAVDPGTGAFFATWFEPNPLEKGFLDNGDGIMVVDVARQRVVADMASQAGTILH